MIIENMIRTIALALEKTGYKYYFVGGAASQFYIDDDNSSKVRPTDDIDCVVEIMIYKDFILFEQKIIELGFTKDNDSKNICRWKYKNIYVDIIPSESKKTLGFTNRWYKEGIENAISKKMGNITIHYFSLPYFMASKMEAYKNKGTNDLFGSTDLEDIIIVMDGIIDLKIFSDFPLNVIDFMRQAFNELMENPHFLDAIIGHIDISPVREKRAMRIYDFIEKFIDT